MKTGPTVGNADVQSVRNGTHRALLEAIDRVCRVDGSPTIAAVAREVNVSPALIHNRYPDVASKIRVLAGKEKQDEITSLKQALELERRRCKDLREENVNLIKELRALASVNETLRQRFALERSRSADNVVEFRARADT